MDNETLPATLYHYTSFDSFVKIWCSKKLLFSNRENTNDLFEKYTNISSPDEKWDIICFYATRILLKRYKQISFTMDFNDKRKGFESPMLWGHYADKCSGVCIELDTSKLNLKDPNIAFGKIEYINSFPKSVYSPKMKEASSIEETYQYIRKNINDIFFKKFKDWKYENEFRLISDKVNSLNITEAINNIYVTNSTSIESKCIEEIVGDKVPVLYLQRVYSKKTYFNAISSKDWRNTLEQWKQLENESPETILDKAKRKASIRVQDFIKTLECNKG